MASVIKLAVDVGVVGATDLAVLLVRCVKLNRWANAATHDGATQADVDMLKQLPQGRWSEHEGAWVAPCTEPNVRHVMDHWTDDEIAYTDGARVLLAHHVATRMLADAHLAKRIAFMRDGKVDEPEAYLYAAHRPPMAHQKVAFQSSRYADFFGFLMEMGTGKTKVGIDVMCDRVRRMQELFKSGKSQQKIFWALIVATKTVCGEWRRQFAEWTTVPTNLELVRGSKLARVEALRRLIADQCATCAERGLDAQPTAPCATCGTTPLRVAVINYEGLDVLGDALEAIPWDLMICDESIWIKNPSAKRTKAAWNIGAHAKSRFIMTGLPITRSINDLYAQFHFLSAGLLGYTSYNAFTSHFGPEGYNIQYWRANILPELQKTLAQFSFIIQRKQCIDLPPKIYATRDIEMGDEQRAAYDRMLKDFVVQLEGGAGSQDDLADGHELLKDAALDTSGFNPDKFAMAQIVLVQMLRLAQITSGFMRMASGKIHRFSPNPKLEAVKELLEETDPGEKIIVWSRFREDVEHLELELSDYRPLKIYGGLGDKQRDATVDAFKGDPKYRLLVAQPKSGGFGLNLQVANHEIFFSNEWGLQERAQAEDRCHRPGQTRNVLIDDLVVPNSIDEIMLGRIRAKKELADLLTNRHMLIDLFRTQLEARQKEEER